MKQPDILIYMSDQHGADYCSWGQVPVDTPILQSMREQGTSFDQAYTPCPLCVPARMSMMSALLPSETGVYDNGYTLSDLTPCFTHALVEAGYETVLIGRMHFIGDDQRHGFTKRLAPDITPVSWKKPFKEIVEERGKTVAAFSNAGSTDLVGAGVSIVTEYDQMVMEAALQYLQEPHDKPQFILVGTFGPHCPYITSEEMYMKYLERVQKPEYFDPESLPDYVKEMKVLNDRVKGEEVTWEIAQGSLAAYCGQIEVMDDQIGILRNEFKTYCNRSGREHLFGYVSDHGDSVGERRMFGKQTYFDKSAKIPMIFEGTRVPKGKAVTDPVSLMDLGPTVCSAAGTSFEIGSGISLMGYFSEKEEDGERLVVSQMMDRGEEGPCASLMLRYKNYKYILYSGYETQALLFDLKQDPLEKTNLVHHMPELAERFFQKAKESWNFNEMEQQYLTNKRNAEWFKAYDSATGFDDSERWKGNSPESKGQLSIAAADRIVMKVKDW